MIPFTVFVSLAKAYPERSEGSEPSQGSAVLVQTMNLVILDGGTGVLSAEY